MLLPAILSFSPRKGRRAAPATSWPVELELRKAFPLTRKNFPKNAGAHSLLNHLEENHPCRDDLKAPHVANGVRADAVSAHLAAKFASSVMTMCVKSTTRKWAALANSATFPIVVKLNPVVRQGPAPNISAVSV